MIDLQDARYKTLVAWLTCAFGQAVVEKNASQLQSSSAIESFMENGNIMLLEAYLEPNGKLQLQNAISFPASAVQEMHFIKAKPEPLNEEPNCYRTGSMLINQSSPSDNLLNSLKHIYGPLLLQQSSTTMSPVLQNLLTELQSGLQNHVSKERLSSTSDDTFFLTPQEEFRYWSEVANRPKKDRLSTMAQIICDAVEPRGLEEDFEILNQKRLEEIVQTGSESLIEKIEIVLDQIWLDSEEYNQKRMDHLLTIMASSIARFIQLKLSELDIWNDKFSTVKIALERALEICYEWTRMILKLTQEEWPNQGKQWKGGPHSNEFILQLTTRLDEILRIRQSYEQVLAHQQQQEDDSNVSSDTTIFESFQQLQALHITPYTEKTWRAAVKQFEQGMIPLEKRITEKLQSKLNALSSRPMLLVQVFQQNKELILRPNIFKQLAQQRTVLLGQLRTQMNIFQNEFHEISSSQDEEKQLGKAMSGFMGTLIATKQIEDRVGKILWTANTFLSDLPDSEAFVREAENFHGDLEKFCEQELKNWMGKIKQMGELQLENTPMISLDSNKKMVVNYNERLVSILQEVPQLIALGFKVDDKIVKMAQIAEEFFSQAVTLKQIANFYNNAHTQVIQSQAAMLLTAATNFEKVIIEFDRQKKAWSKQNGEKYISQLKTASEAVTSENRKLRKYHLMVNDKVVQLFNINLLSDRDLWIDKAREIEKIFKVMEGSERYKNMETWIDHWNFQVYKALEHQYRMGMETLNENLSEIRVDLVFKEKRIQFSPSFEHIKQGYYEKMKDFIAFPETFAGIGNKNLQQLYKEIIYRNYEGLKVVYSKSNALFARLGRMKKKFADHVQLGTIVGDSTEEMEQLVKENVLDVAQWEANFRMLKEKGKEVERIENSIKIDCILVSTLQIKATLDDQLQKLGEIMVKVLRDQSGSHLQKIDQYVTESLDSLHKSPQTMEEIGQSHATCRRLTQEKKVVYLEFEKFDKLNRTLKSVAGVSLDQTAVRERWHDFENTIAAHETYLRDRTTALRKDIEIKLQTFAAELQKFIARWHEFKPKNNNFVNKEQSKKDISFIKERREEYNDFKSRSDEIIKECDYFGVNPVIVATDSSVAIPIVSHLTDIEEDISKYEQMWALYEQFLASMDAFAGKDWITFKKVASNEFDDYILEWNQRLRAETVKNSITAHIQEEIDYYIEFKDLIKFLQGEGWTEEHWAALFKFIKLPTTMTLDKLVFGDFLSRAAVIVEASSAIKELNERALGEDQIRKALQEIKIWASSTEFNMLEYKNTSSKRSVMLIKEWKDILTAVGDNQSLLQSLKESKFIAQFSGEVTTWEEQMITLDGYLLNLNQIQRKWVYLEPIFQRGSLPSHQQVFHRVDKEFVGIMSDIDADKRVVQLAKRNITDMLKRISDQLEVCQKALNAFLEEKRGIFPRFYFIGDDDLLEILGQSQNPEVIQSHLKKLFAGIHSVQFDEANTNIVSMCSAEGEIVPLKTTVPITEKVEEWLSNLDIQMRLTLKSLLVDCDKSSEFLLDSFPSQILCLSAYISFTKKCEHAIKNKTLDQLHVELKQQLNEYTGIDVRDNRVLDLKIKSLILDLIHNIDVVEQLQDSNVTGNVSVNDWIWQKQLRFYMSESSDPNVPTCIIKMCNATFDYTYEYQGNVQKLVHTPLTDKCYLTLTQAMHLGYGGNPYGPAGTGKTESVKALGHLFGRQVLVFNCDEGIDFKSMGRIFIGLVKCGAWGCFDEFNRLKEDQLSAISQQIQIIQAAIKDKKLTPIEILGKSVVVDMNAGIFVTLNPAGKGYGGRSKLPDNLKQLFRSVAMAAPDNDLIAEVILYSEGFQNAKYLGRKLVAIFTLSKQLLSPQQHYDWGLRALKAVLRSGGDQIQQVKRSKKPTTKESESQIIIKALRVNTLSKLTYDDSKIFDSIVRDVFPGIEAPDISYLDLEKAIIECLKEMNLSQIETQMKKILQFYEASKQRMGVVLVGPSGSGKTTVWKVLLNALRKLGKQMVTYVVNPKAMPRQQLLGNMDMDTREWSDGIITSNARKVVKEPLDTTSWIICDGDIDPEWVESLNSVLDDNHLLTMPNGERIQFGNNVNFIFETHSLQYASPATVTRMGMIFLSEEDVDIKSLVNAWLNKENSEDMRKTLAHFIDAYFYKAIDIIFKPEYRNEFVVETTIMGVVLNALSHIYSRNAHDQHHSDYTKGEFTSGLIRGLGGILPIKTRGPFAREIFELCEVTPPDLRRPLDCYYSRQNGIFHQYSLDGNADVGLAFEDLERYPMIHTVDIQRASDIIYPWLEHMEPFIVVGPEGCGKSMLLNNLFQDVKNTQIATIHCNSQTNAINVIQKLNQSCSVFTTNSGKVLRPKERERLILYLKDLNLPKPDMYGTTQLIAFLQQLVTHNGYYDANLEWIGLEKIQIVGSMNPSSTVGRYPINSRLTSVVRVVSLAYPEKDQLQVIYNEILKTALSKDFGDHPVWKLPHNISLFAQAMVEFYDKVTSKFSVDDYAHYLFTPRDITRWVLGLLNYNYTANDTKCNELLDVFIYEARRLFRDRLVTDLNHYDSLELGLYRHFEQLGYAQKEKENILFTSLYGAISKSSNETGASSKRLLAPMPIIDYAKLIKNGSTLYKRDNRELKIFLMSEYAEFVARVDRVLSQPCGSLLLVGRPGIGRKNTVVLVSHLLNMELFSPSMSLGYNLKSFKIELKQLLQTTGINNQPVCLLIEDHHLVEETFLEYINSLLSSGEIPGLYAQEELDQMMPQLREQVSKEVGFFESPYSLFISRIKRNLRLVLAMDPTNPHFASRCQSNPAIFTQCSIQWVESWSKQGLARIPGFLMPETMKALADQTSKEIVRYMLMIHDSATKISATLLHFIRFIDTYKSIYNSKKESKTEQQSHLKAGLTKLNEAKDSVDKLSKEAEEKKKLLAVKRTQQQEALKHIQASMELSVQETTSMTQIKEKISVEEKKLNEKKETINNRLSSVKPILESAQQAVGKLKIDNINEIKVLTMPPAGIKDILEGVLRLMGKADTSWKSVRNFLNERGVISQILNFDARSCSQKVIQEVKQYVQKQSSSFEEENARRSSVAAAPLAKWVLANIEYAEVIQQVGPLEQELDELNKSQAHLTTKLSQCESKLASLTNKIEELQREYEQKVADSALIMNEVEKAEKTLQASQSLLGKLSGERDRWSKQFEHEEKLLKALPKLVLLAAAFITYLPQAAEDVRKQFMQQWIGMVKVDTNEPFDLKLFMSSESEMLKYKAEGLPADELSMENAITIMNSVQYPMIIDPSLQATEWLETNMMQKSIESTNAQDPKFSTTLELAIRFGKTLLIKEIDSIDPILYPLLRKEIMIQGPRKSIKLGDKMIDFNDDFRLFLITRNTDISLTPDAAALVTQVNFTVTRSGLEGQLLGLTLQQENPELEKKKSDLLKREEDSKIHLSDLEKQLLNELANAKGDILENVSLINKLTQIKQKSASIMESLTESSKLKAELDLKREAYRPFARNGSRLYFLIGDMKRVNPMYQFSLAVFLNLFKKTLESKSEKAANLEARIALLSEELQKLTFNFISRALFKEDRLIFAIHTVHGLFPELFTGDEWDYFIGALVKQQASNPPQIPKWVSADRKAAFLSFVNCLPELAKSFEVVSDTATWEKWFTSKNCYAEFPANKKATPFQSLLMLKTFRPDQLYSALSQFACKILGVPSVSPQSLKLETLYKELSSNQEPILLITTPGADPSQELEEMANRIVGSDKFIQIAMGGGQVAQALAALRKCANSGQWLCLKNLHLVVSWLPVLEKELSLLLSTSHQNFRLWLTTESHDAFPTILLQQSLKLTVESPPGIKQNMQRTFDSWDEGFMVNNTKSNTTSNPKIRSRILFILSWFHAVVQERRSFIPQGWTKFYEFSSADLRSASDVIEAASFANGRTSPDWQTIHGLLENAIYGGRVDNDFDIRVLRCYLAKYFNDTIITSNASELFKGFPIPTSTAHAEFVKTIQTLTDNDQPLLFGLSPNADKLVQTSRSARVVDTLKSIVVHAEESSKFNKEKWANTLTPILMYWRKIVESNSKILFSVEKRTTKDVVDPIQVFVNLEFRNAKALVKFVDNRLKEIDEVVKGTALVTSTIQSDAAALLAGNIPDKWQEKWEHGPGDKVQTWLTEIVNKTVALSHWQEHSLDNKLLTEELDLSNLFNPNIFLNALKQYTARSTAQPLDDLTCIICSIKDAKNPGPKLKCSVQIKSLLLQGCSFDGATLSELTTEDGPSLTTFPNCEITWISDKEWKEIQGKAPTFSMQTPLYFSPTREKLLTKLLVPCGYSKEDEQKFILSGTALFVESFL